MEYNNIYLGDCLSMIDELDNESIDLVITSPPYNVDLGNNKFNKKSYSLYNDNKNHIVYILWLKEIFEKLFKKIKEGGRVCINVGDGKNGRIPTTNDVMNFMQEIGYLPNAHIIWNKNTTSCRSAWGSWKSPHNPSYPTPFEHILIFSKKTLSLNHKGITDLTKEEFVKYAYSLWEFAPETKSEHPAPFPKELPYRLIKMNSYIGDVVLDIFSGSGTTCLVAKELNRKYIGIELDKTYYEQSIKRLESEE